MNDISPLEIIQRILRYWWIPAAGLFLGGLIGWGFTRLHPPVYEATATYQVTIDEQLLLTEGEVTTDMLPLDFNHQNPFYSPAADVFSTAAANLAAGSQPVQLSDFSLDRRGTRWMAAVRSTDPVNAARLANQWVTDADAGIRQAQMHSAEARTLESQRDTLQKCFTNNDFTQANLCAGTSFTTPAEMESFSADLEQRLLVEQKGALSIDPALQVSFVAPAAAPVQPVLYSRAFVILAGSVIGLLAGLLVVPRLPARRA